MREHLLYLSGQWPSPDILIIHAGANDLGRVKSWDLMCEVKRDLSSFKLLFPFTVLVFSEMIPRLLWSNYSSLHYLDKIRKRLNRTIRNSVISLGGLSYRHVDLEGFLPGFYRVDFVHLSDVGIDIFILGLQNMIEQATVLGGLQPLRC